MGVLGLMGGFSILSGNREGEEGVVIRAEQIALGGVCKFAFRGSCLDDL